MQSINKKAKEFNYRLLGNTNPFNPNHPSKKPGYIKDCISGLSESDFGKISVDNLDYWIEKEQNTIDFCTLFKFTEYESLNIRSSHISKITAKEKASELERKSEQQLQKTLAIERRRNHFNNQRAQLFLQMLDAGIPYICAHEKCSEYKELTIDHIVPIARGGGDEINNLCFMCQSHNSEKGAK